MDSYNNMEQNSNNDFGVTFVGKQFSSELNQKGDTYLGQFLNGTKYGKGKISHTDGDIYEGEWNFGKKNGQGVLKHSNGITFIGKWDNDNFIKGTIKWPDGKIYNGDYDGIGKGRHGYGTFSKINKYNKSQSEIDNSYGTYTGQWKNDMKNGTGRMMWEDGIVYEGSWVNDKMSGKGTFIIPNKETYIGEFKNGLKHGSGTVRYRDNLIFEGTWLNGIQEGEGLMTLPDGKKFRGRWE